MSIVMLMCIGKSYQATFMENMLDHISLINELIEIREQRKLEEEIKVAPT